MTQRGERKVVKVYTDGACRGNPGPGGCGALLMTEGHERELWGGERSTTNNRMELLAAIRALEALKRPCRVELHTDSAYLRNGITTWLKSWKARGWKTSSNSAVKNRDLWEQLEQLAAQHQVEIGRAHV